MARKRNYRVKRDDTWFSIAEKELGDRNRASELASANKSLNTLRGGQVINVTDTSPGGRPKFPTPGAPTTPAPPPPDPNAPVRRPRGGGGRNLPPPTQPPALQPYVPPLQSPYPPGPGSTPGGPSPLQPYQPPPLQTYPYQGPTQPQLTPGSPQGKPVQIKTL